MNAKELENGRSTALIREKTLYVKLNLKSALVIALSVNNLLAHYLIFSVKLILGYFVNTCIV